MQGKKCEPTSVLRGAAKHRGSVPAPLPATSGSNPGSTAFLDSTGRTHLVLLQGIVQMPFAAKASAKYYITLHLCDTCSPYHSIAYINALKFCNLNIALT